MNFSEDLRLFLTALLMVIGGLLPIVNPVASAPVFLTMTRGSDAATRAKLAVEIAISTFLLLMGSLIFGAFVLKLFGLSIPVVQVAGGAVLIALAWNLLHAEGEADEVPDAKANKDIILRAFYPLTLPVTVDPGAISVAITLGANHAHGARTPGRFADRGAARGLPDLDRRVAGLPLCAAHRTLDRTYADDGDPAPVRVHPAVHRRRDHLEWRAQSFRGAALCHGDQADGRGIAVDRRGSQVNVEFRLLIEGALLAIAALLPIVNPLGAAPVFLAMTGGADDATRAMLARRVAVNGFILLVASVLVGGLVLEFFGLTVPVVQIAGGLIVCSLAWRLLNEETNLDGPPVVETPATLATRAFYPLTLPLTVGPGAISVAITLGANYPSTAQPFAADVASSIVGIVVVCATIYACFRYSRRLRVCWARPEPPSSCACRPSSCCASACRSSGTAWTRCWPRGPRCPRPAEARGNHACPDSSRDDIMESLLRARSTDRERSTAAASGTAGVAQLVEQRIRNAKVGSSTLFAGTNSREPFAPRPPACGACAAPTWPAAGAGPAFLPAQRDSACATHCAVSFSCTEFWVSRRSSPAKSTRSSGWSWLKHENT